MFRSTRAAVAGAIVAVAVSATVAAAPPASAAATVPSDFTDVAVATVSSPTAVAPLDTDRVVVLEKSGNVRLLRNGALVTTPALSLTVCASGEMGLLGFAAGADFAATGAVFVYYTAVQRRVRQHRLPVHDDR